MGKNDIIDIAICMHAHEYRLPGASCYKINKFKPFLHKSQDAFLPRQTFGCVYTFDFIPG